MITHYWPVSLHRALSYTEGEPMLSMIHHFRVFASKWLIDQVVSIPESWLHCSIQFHHLWPNAIFHCARLVLHNAVITCCCGVLFIVVLWRWESSAFVVVMTCVVPTSVCMKHWLHLQWNVCVDCAAQRKHEVEKIRQQFPNKIPVRAVSFCLQFSESFNSTFNVLVTEIESNCCGIITLETLEMVVVE